MISIGLYNTKNPYNFGSICRLAGCWEANSVLIQGTRFQKSSADTQKFYRHYPVIHVDNLMKSKPVGLIPVAVEIDDEASNIVNYKHPKNAYYIFGAEDVGLPRDILAQCKDKIYLPTKFCLNLAVTVANVLYDRNLKKELFGFKKNGQSPSEGGIRYELCNKKPFVNHVENKI